MSKSLFLFVFFGVLFTPGGVLAQDSAPDAVDDWDDDYIVDTRAAAPHRPVPVQVAVVGPPPRDLVRASGLGSEPRLHSDPLASHRGFTASVSVGSGRASCDQCVGTGSGVLLGLSLGGFVQPRLALQYQSSQWIKYTEIATVALSSHTAAAQVWVTSDLWMRLGLGVGRLAVAAGDVEVSVTGSAGHAAIGYEILDKETWVLDLAVTLSSISFNVDGVDENYGTAGAEIGARWK